MNWYLVPYCTVPLSPETPESLFYVPGVGSGVVSPARLTAFIGQAQSPRLTPVSGLVGLHHAPSTVPDGWVPKTLDEARVYFESVVGRPPSNDEVF